MSISVWPTSGPLGLAELYTFFLHTICMSKTSKWRLRVCNGVKVANFKRNNVELIHWNNLINQGVSTRKYISSI